MEPLKYKCDECGNTYRNKSSRKCLVNGVHLNKKNIGQANKQIMSIHDAPKEIKNFLKIIPQTNYSSMMRPKQKVQHPHAKIAKI